MARIYNQQTLQLLEKIAEKNQISAKHLFNQLEVKIDYKDFYNTLFRLTQQELITKEDDVGEIILKITDEGKKFLLRAKPVKDGVWKLVIFDIPEKQKYVRTVLRAKLKALHFKKWQNSIWISPYKMDSEIEDELNELGKKFFVRLIKSKEINITSDLEKLFGQTSL
jgi:DNA-binding transcriptional regulator PaaX